MRFWFAILVVICLIVRHNLAKHEPCKKGDWRFMVMLVNTADDSLCGGVIWNSSTVLTSAGCLMTSDKKILNLADIAVYLVHGEPENGWKNPKFQFNVSKVNGSTLFSTVYRVFPHTQFILHPGINRNKDGDTLKDYIGLIRLETSIDFNGKHKEVIPVPFGRKTQLNSCAAIGWGEKDPNPDQHYHMRQIALSRHPSDLDCHKATKLYVPGMHICVSGSDSDSILPGDYGGPLMCPDGDGFDSLVGIALHNKYGNSFSNNISGSLSYFLNVSHYRDWIEKNTFKDFTDSTTKSVTTKSVDGSSLAEYQWQDTSVDYQSTDRTTPRSKVFFWIIIIAIIDILSIAGTLTYWWFFKKSIHQDDKGTSLSLKKSIGSAKKTGKSKLSKSKTSQRSKRMSKSLTGKDKSSLSSTKSPTSNIIKSALSMSKPSSKSTE